MTEDHLSFRWDCGTRAAEHNRQRAIRRRMTLPFSSDLSSYPFRADRDLEPLRPCEPGPSASSGRLPLPGATSLTSAPAHLTSCSSFLISDPEPPEPSGNRRKLVPARPTGRSSPPGATSLTSAPAHLTSRSTSHGQFVISRVSAMFSSLATSVTLPSSAANVYSGRTRFFCASSNARPPKS